MIIFYNYFKLIFGFFQIKRTSRRFRKKILDHVLAFIRVRNFLRHFNKLPKEFFRHFKTLTEDVFRYC
jgi:hypothetical protein